MRDIYVVGGQRILVTTDRVSAFDRVLGAVPFKGQVLNQLSAWWFEQTRDIVPNHVIAVPDPNVTIAREARAAAGRGHRARLHHRRHLHLALDAVRPGRRAPLRAGAAAGAAQERSAAGAGHHADHQGHRRRARRAADPGRGRRARAGRARAVGRDPARRAGHLPARAGGRPARPG